MTSNELSTLIAGDLAANRSELIWHGRAIDQCLLEPAKVTCLNSHADNQPEQYWLVFEEGPNAGAGYKVVYEEESGEFGLAVTGETEPVVVGIYGGFVETLNSM